MPWKTTIRLLILSGLTAVALLLLARMEKEAQRTIRADVRLPTPRTEDVRRLAIETESFRLHCERRNGRWRIVRPWAASADSGRIEHILSVIETLTPRDIVTAEQQARRGLTLEDYGLDRPRIRFELCDGLSETVLSVGHYAPLDDLLYARLGHDDTVFALVRELTKVAPPDIEFLRDRTLMPGDMRRANRLEIQRPRGGFIRLDRVAAGHWVLRQPFEARADAAAVGAMLDILHKTQTERFVWDRRVDEPDPPGTMDRTLTSYRLTADDAVARVTVWIEGEDIPSELIFGKESDEEPGLIYARLRDRDSIVAVGESILAAFSVEDINALRDRSLFGLRAGAIAYAAFQDAERRMVLERDPKVGWRIVEPVQWKADELVVGQCLRELAELRIEQFADGSEIRAKALGLDPPALRVQLAKTRPEQAVSRRLLIGRSQPHADLVYVRFEDEPMRFGEGASVFTVSARALEVLGGEPTRPLAWRDRTMLAVDPANVRRLTRVRADSRQTVERTEDGGWSAPEFAGDLVAREAVENILFAVANLRAHKMESHNPRDLAPYGLDRPTTVLTLGLVGEAGIRTSVLLGRGAGADGVYAMIQGRDIVFTLDNAVAKTLGADLIVAPSAAAKAEQ